MSRYTATKVLHVSEFGASFPCFRNNREDRNRATREDRANSALSSEAMGNWSSESMLRVLFAERACLVLLFAAVKFMSYEGCREAQAPCKMLHVPWPAWGLAGCATY
jgi:hypothetical protein